MVDDDNFICELEIPKYPIKIATTKKRRPNYYNKYKGKGVSRDIPKTYRQKVNDGKWQFNKNGYLVNGNGDRVVANPKKAGTRNYEKLSGNRFYSGMHHRVRINLINGMKDFYRPYVQEQLDPIPDAKFPLAITWDFYTTLGRKNYDMSNFSFYYKYLEDTFSEEEDPDGNPIKTIIPDDNVQYITWPPAPRFIPVDNWEDRKFVFRFYEDDRQSIRTIWQHEDIGTWGE